MKNTLRKVQILLPVIFLLSFAAKSQLVDLHDCVNNPTDALRPYGQLVTDSTYFYGTTNEGGAYGYGSVFRIKPDGSGFELLHSFAGSVSDGAGSYGELLLNNDTLYGMTYTGGLGDDGTIYSLKKDGTGYTQLHEFGFIDGKNPMGGLIMYNDTLYGTASGGGANLVGTIFKIAKDGTGFSVIHDFITDAGSMPTGSLTLVPAGFTSDGMDTFYGTTYWGGITNNGVIFRIHTDGTTFNTQYEFTGDTLGQHPRCTLTPAAGILLGTTYGGGANTYGVAFTFSPMDSSLYVMHDFTGDTADGGRPSSLMYDSDNAICYGVCETGGLYASGILYKMDFGGGNFTKLYDFTDSLQDGSSPYSPPILVNNSLYGVTPYGGAINFGIVYRFDPLSTGTDKISFTENTINVYPNPCSGIFRIESSMPGMKRIEIDNSLGEKVYLSVASDRENKIELKNAARGIYIVKISTDEFCITGKLIVE